MSQQVFFIIQILADCALLVAIVFFIYRIHGESRRKPEGVDPGMLAEFRKFLVDCQNGSASLVQAMDEGKKALKEISRALDDKERRLKKIIEQSEIQLEKADPGPGTGVFAGEAGFSEAVRMARRGMDLKEISKRLGLPEGEVSLILDLDRRRSDAAWS